MTFKQETKPNNLLGTTANFSMLSKAKTSILRLVSSEENSGWFFPNTDCGISQISSWLVPNSPNGYDFTATRDMDNNKVFFTVIINRNKSQQNHRTQFSCDTFEAAMKDIPAGTQIEISFGYCNKNTVVGHKKLPATIFNVVNVTAKSDGLFTAVSIYRSEAFIKLEYRDIKRLTLKALADKTPALASIVPAGTMPRKFIEDVFHVWNRI